MFVKHLDMEVLSTVMSTTEKLCKKWVIKSSQRGLNTNQQRRHKTIHWAMWRIQNIEKLLINWILSNLFNKQGTGLVENVLCDHVIKADLESITYGADRDEQRPRMLPVFIILTFSCNFATLVVAFFFFPNTFFFKEYLKKLSSSNCRNPPLDLIQKPTQNRRKGW